jgi:hypothetical protein
MDMDGFGSRVLKRSTYLTYIYREPVMFTGFKLFYKNDNWNNSKMYTPCCNSHQNQATFNFNNLPSHEKLFRLSVPRTSCYGRLPIQIKETPAADPQQIPLENKVVNKIIAPKVTNDAATILSKGSAYFMLP